MQIDIVELCCLQTPEIDLTSPLGPYDMCWSLFGWICYRAVLLTSQRLLAKRLCIHSYMLSVCVLSHVPYRADPRLVWQLCYLMACRIRRSKHTWWRTLVNPPFYLFYKLTRSACPLKNTATQCSLWPGSTLAPLSRKWPSGSLELVSSLFIVWDICSKRFLPALLSLYVMTSLLDSCGILSI